MEHDPYVYLGTNVLINRLNIQDSAKLQGAEAALYFKMQRETLPQGNFDYDHLKAIHKHFFGELYTWAGEERKVDIIKGDSHFARKEFITNEINKQFAKIKTENYLQNLDKENFIKKAAHHFNEINAAHPFREGNGRTLRAFFSSLAKQAGYQFDWTKTTEQEYTQASILGFNGYDKSMEEIFEKVALLLIRHINLNTEHKELIDYINKQAQLNDLVKLKNTYLAKDPQAAKVYGEQAMALDKKLEEIAHNVLQQPAIQRELELRGKEPLSTTIRECGGFQGLKTKLEQDKLAAKDITALLRHMQFRVQEVDRSRNQSRDQSR